MSHSAARGPAPSARRCARDQVAETFGRQRPQDDRRRAGDFVTERRDEACGIFVELAGPIGDDQAGPRSPRKQHREAGRRRIDPLRIVDDHRVGIDSAIVADASSSLGGTSYGSAGSGMSTHVAVELLSARGGRRHRARSLQGQLGCDRRPDGGSCAADDGVVRLSALPHVKSGGSCVARGTGSRTPGRPARRADDRRGRISGGRHDDLVGRRRTSPARPSFTRSTRRSGARLPRRSSAARFAALGGEATATSPEQFDLIVRNDLATLRDARPRGRYPARLSVRPGMSRTRHDIARFGEVPVRARLPRRPGRCRRTPRRPRSRTSAG